VDELVRGHTRSFAFLLVILVTFYTSVEHGGGPRALLASRT
jgi:hypothetical protein